VATGLQRRNDRSFVKIALVAIAMFGFGYLLVPLYDVFCEITGLNGKTGRIDEAEIAARYQPDMTRLVTVQFIANNNLGMPWEFGPGVESMQVHPGKVYATSFKARNPTGHDMVGQAVPAWRPPRPAVISTRPSVSASTSSRWPRARARTCLCASLSIQTCPGMCKRSPWHTPYST